MVFIDQLFVGQKLVYLPVEKARPPSRCSLKLGSAWLCKLSVVSFGLIQWFHLVLLWFNVL